MNDAKTKQKEWSDGTPRKAREPQELALDAITLDFNRGVHVVAGNYPPGYGKSFMARALQRESSPCDIITSSNPLIDQYRNDYPVLNAVMGKDHYPDSDAYQEAHNKARAGAPSIFNPLSYYYARQRGLREPNLLVVDEAHLLIDMLMYTSAYVFPVSKTRIPLNATSELDLIKWCKDRYTRLKQAISMPDAPGMLFQEFEKIARLYDTLSEGTEKQMFQISHDLVQFNGRKVKCVVLQPLRVPDTLIRSVTASRRLLVMSGTMTRFDAEHLAAGRSLSVHLHDYLTPKANRPVYYDPLEAKDRHNHEAIAAKIRKIYNANPVPTLVHVTYGEQEALEHLLNDLHPLVNTSRNKALVANKFRAKGGIWLAAGCAEGLDLKYDACRQVIVPRVRYADKGNLFVQKRSGLEDGQYWYVLRAIQNTVQALGRGVRAADDECVGHILDPYFPSAFAKVGHEFAELNMKWSTNG